MVTFLEKNKRLINLDTVKKVSRGPFYDIIYSFIKLNWMSMLIVAARLWVQFPGLLSNP